VPSGMYDSCLCLRRVHVWKWIGGAVWYMIDEVM